jgi:hypothetical protein
MAMVRRPGELDDDDLIAELWELQRLADAEAVTDPATLLAHLSPETYWRCPHLDVISGEIGQIGWTYDREHPIVGPQLMVMEPPQTGKTATAVVGAAFWWLVNHPTHRVVIGSYNDTLAQDRGREIRELVRRYGARYGLILARDSYKVQDWHLITGGGVKSVGVGGGITGSRGNLIIIDDPHKSRAEADSKVARDRVYRWVSADMISRMFPGAPMLLVMTPWHPEDIAARLLIEHGRVEDGGAWRVLRMPAFCTDPENDPLGRAYGEPLTHPHIDTKDKQRLIDHWNNKRNKSSLQDWYALYMCDPQPTEGALVSIAMLRERRCFQTGTCETAAKRAAVAIDPSGGGRDTAGIVAGYLGTDNKVYLTHDKSGVMSSIDWSRTACQLAIDTDADTIIFESNYGGDMGALAIRTAWAAISEEATSKYETQKEEIEALPDGQQRAQKLAELESWFRPYKRLRPRVKSVSARKSKRLRAEPVAQQIVEDNVRFATYLPDLEHEWATWQPDSSESPGRIDSSVYLVLEMLPRQKQTPKKQTRPRGSLPTTSMSPLG